MLQRLKCHTYRIIGFVSLSIGVLGVFLPLLPTTCFILLAAWAFSKSSPPFYQALYNHRVFGGIIRDWQAHRAMSLKAKLIASLSIVVSFSLSLLFINMSMVGMLVVLGIMLVLLASIALIRTKHSDGLRPAH